MKQKCKDISCPLRLKCAIANGQVKGNVTIFKGYLKEFNKCEFYLKIKKEDELPVSQTG